MIDAITVVRKELLELFGNRHSSRGALVQGAVTILVAGVLFPSAGAAVWSDVHATAMLYLFFPSVTAASVAADAFAGERERKTLETLLATPLSDHAIFLGKVATAVIFAQIVTLASLLAAVTTVNVVQHGGPLFLPSAELLLGVVGGALGASLLTAALAVTISMRVPVARSAQQMSSLLSMATAGVVALVVRQLHVPLTWALVLWIDVALCAAGAAALLLVRQLFRRDRFFEER